MKRFLGISLNVWWVLLIWMAVLLGLLLRTYKADEYPLSQNDDGLFYAWVGSSSWDDFLHPTSLTIFEDSEALFWRSQYKDFDPRDRFGFRLSEPWFDSPVFASMLIALPARFMGYVGFEQIPHMLVRLPAIVVSVFTLILTYLLGRELFGKRVGFWGLLVLSVWPLAVFSQRQSYLENFLTPLLLLGLLGVLKLKKSEKKWEKIVLLVSLVSGWVKFSGFFIPAILAYWLSTNKNWKLFWKVLLVFGVSIGAYFAYGHFVGGGVFWETLLSQGGRGSYLLSWFHVMGRSGIYENISDSWWYLGW
ncbi:glycosyltransferase family 39 protein, partial [Patescibacteria group bacterium]